MDAAADADTELLRCIADGDARRAGALLVARYADDVFAVCRAMVRDAALAEDLSQDVFGRAFVALAEFRGDATPRTWLLRIAKNRCIDHLRKQRREPRGLDEEPDAHPAEEPLAIDALLSRADLAEALEALNEGERALVVLRFGHGLEYADLASAFGLREGTVRMRLSRAVAKMREAIDRAASGGRMRRAREDGDAAAALDLEDVARDEPARGEMAAMEVDVPVAAPSRREQVAPPPAPGAPPPAPRAPQSRAPVPARVAPASAAFARPTSAIATRGGTSAPPVALRWIASGELRARLDVLASSIT